MAPSGGVAWEARAVTDNDDADCGAALPDLKNVLRITDLYTFKVFFYRNVQNKVIPALKWLSVFTYFNLFSLSEFQQKQKYVL